MTKTTLKVFYSLLLIIGTKMYATDSTIDCANAYSAATYALSHTKKSLAADNFDHQKYYADRALEAFEKTKKMVESCGCDASYTPIADGIENLALAIDPEDWDLGRHYAKRAHENAQKLLAALDRCTGSSGSLNYSLSASNSDDIAMLSSEEEQQLAAKQQQLENEQRKLMEQKEELERKIEEQKILAEQAREQREIEYQTQLDLKKMTEDSWVTYESSLRELALAMGCESALIALESPKVRSESQIQDESLAATREYYIQQSIRLQHGALEALKKCAKSQ